MHTADGRIRLDPRTAPRRLEDNLQAVVRGLTVRRLQKKALGAGSVLALRTTGDATAVGVELDRR